MPYDACVIGAGPAGASVAALLARAGWRVALVEKAAFPRRKVCGEFISAATMPLLEACGVGAAFQDQAGPPVTRVALYAGARQIEAPLPSGGGRALGRESLDTLLRDAAIAAGAKLFEPAEITGLHRTANGHACAMEHEAIEARIVIAACGSWNARGPFGLFTPPRGADLLAFKAHFQNARLPEGLMPLLAFPGGYGGMVHSDGGRVSLSCCIRRDALTAIRAHKDIRAADAVFAHIRSACDGAARALEGAEPDGAALAAGPIRPGMRARYRDGIFFVGNLAGEAHPVIAEGISMAVQASHLLARILIAEPDPDAAGARYARAWRRRFAPRLTASALIARMMMGAPGRAVAGTAVQIFPALLTFGARIAGKAA